MGKSSLKELSMEKSLEFSKNLPKAIRKIILEQAYRAHVGHIGSALSIADIITAIYLLESSLESEKESNRFILSKGHASLALYAVLFLTGKLGREALNSYCVNGGLLGVHPEKSEFGIEFSTGSLGQGLSFGVGAALALKKKGIEKRVRVLISDAELNEGSTWEAIMFAAHHSLSNLDVIVDLNGQQAMGFTLDILNLSQMVNRWEAFGWKVREVNGHDVNAIQENLKSMALSQGGPQVLLAKTKAGKGVSFMEGQIKWHYMPLTENEFQKALTEVAIVQ